jgi:DinB superfamily
VTSETATSATAAQPVDLRRTGLADVRELDLRSPSRDVWKDEAALWDRLFAAWPGLDEAAWHLPGAAPSDAGGPDWSLAEHVGHLADWQELAIDYVGTALQTGRWPSDDDYDGGDFDRFNERRRAPWTTMPSTSILARLGASRPRLLEVAHRLSLEDLRGDDAWGWVYMTLHGHYLDHLTIIEPWADRLRDRQVDGDPFIAYPRPADIAGLAADVAVIDGLFDELVRGLPQDRWLAAEVTPGWTLRDHVGHLADWMDEGARAIDIHRDTGVWLSDPEEGIDAWNQRHVVARRGESPEETLARYDAAHTRLLDAARSMSMEELRSPDGWSWVYDCLHGHVRKHLAMVGRYCVTSGWPAA